jgi:predicted AlkP superfamily phosphohydrolase/phosphomutase
LGVYWWLNVDRNRGEITSPNADSFYTADIWDYLCNDGYHCAILNIPMTYPPSPIDGTMVSGFGAAFDAGQGQTQSITYPPEFQRDLTEKYGWKTTIDDVTTPEGLQTAYDVISSRFDLLSDILEDNYEYVHLTAFYINTLEHKYGDGEETSRAWELIDERLGQISTDDTILLLYSDHGHRHIEHTFVVNRWLLDNGYLSLSSDTTADTEISHHLYSALESLDVSPKRIAAYGRRILPESVYDRVMPSKFPISSAQLADQIKWDQTDALAFSQGPLYLNRSRLGDRYPAVRAKIRRELSELTYKGEQVLSDVQPAEDVYNGPYVDDAPDLILSSNDGWEIYGGILPSTFESQVMSWTSGNHPVGMLLACGPGIESQRLSEQSLLDIAPTILHLFDSPIPSDMDGSVIEEIAGTETAVSTRDPIEVTRTTERSRNEGLEQRLEDIGYLE